MSGNLPEVSVIICHHKGTLIYKAVDSLLKSEGVTFEIIIATSDETLFNRYAGDSRVRQVFIEGGPARKRNIAARFANGEFLAFYDDDIEATPRSLFQLRSSLITDDKIGMVFGKLLNMEFHDRFDEAGSYLTPTGFLWARAESGCKDIGQYEDAVPILAGKSAACMIHKKLFWRIGAFDASYEILGEETDLAWRVWLAGFQVWFVPQSVTYHAFNTRFKPVDFYIPRRVYFNGCRNYLSMLFTNLSYPRVIISLVTQIVVWTAAGVGMLVTGKHEAGINIFKGLGYFFNHMPILLRKRRKVQESRKIKDSELMPIVMRNPPISYYVKRFFHYIKTGRHG